MTLLKRILPPRRRKQLRPAKHWLYHLYYQLYRLPPSLEFRPVFVIGCGRSGTTILGKLISQHPSIAYLNEARHIWFYERSTDIWRENAVERGGKLILTDSDVRPITTGKIRRSLKVEQVRKNHQIVAEKLPINTFRIDFIREIFPEAHFIHIIRHGAEVGRSIATLTEQGRWYRKSHKWEFLTNYAQQIGEQSRLQMAGDNPFLMGLFEWHLSTGCALNSLAQVAQEKQLEVRYETLLEQPVATAEMICDFLNVPLATPMQQFAQTEIRRRSPSATKQTLSPEALLIAGKRLEQLGYA